MTKELPTYRQWLEQINQATGNKLLLTQTDVQKVTGRGYKFVKNHLGISSEGISNVALANQLAMLDKVNNDKSTMQKLRIQSEVVPQQL